MHPTNSRPDLSLESIVQARDLIDPTFLNTPQYIDAALSAQVGCDVLLKIETLNPIRCFKGRGASLYMQLAVPKGERVVGASAGNFGQAVAYAGRARGNPVTIFAAETANASKIARIRDLGAEVILCGHDFDAAKEAARAFAATTDARFVEDAADIETVIGAGTIGLELESAHLDALLVPLGNGALINGIATWLKAHAPGTRIIGVCAANAPSMEISWRTGTPTTTDSANTIADGIGVRIPIASAVQLTTSLVDEIVLVEEDAIRDALRVVRDAAGMLLEPSAAVGIAALLTQPGLCSGTVGTILTGSNYSAELLAELTGRV